jgi:putative (di)nucleoside polyphosphate hydrolase
MAEIYRQNVGIIVCRQGKVLLCARADQPDFQWQFPQGGMETGEDIITAARRELKEETGISSVRLIHKMPMALRYRFPAKCQHAHFAPYVGQEQHWVLFAFDGDDKDIDFTTNPEEIEFKAFEWADISEAPKRIVEFKRQVYQQVADYFTPFIQECAHVGKI